MDALELKDTTHFLRDFGDIHHGYQAIHLQHPYKGVYKKNIYRFSMINFSIFNEK